VSFCFSQYIDGKESIRRAHGTWRRPSPRLQTTSPEPTTKKIEPKTMYCEKQNDTVVCAGVYK